MEKLENTHTSLVNRACRLTGERGTRPCDLREGHQLGPAITQVLEVLLLRRELCRLRRHFGALGSGLCCLVLTPESWEVGEGGRKEREREKRGR